MKKLLWIVLILLIFNATPAWATWTVGNHASARSSNGVGPTTSGIDTTGNNGIVVAIVYADGCATHVHDNKNSDSAWSLSATTTANGFITAMWTLNSSGTFGAAHTFQAATTGCLNYASIYALGLNSATVESGPFVDQSVTNTTSSAALLQVGSITPTANDEIIIGVLGIGIVNGSGFALNSGFTVIEHQDQADFNQGGALAYKIQTTAAAVNPQWTWVNSGAASALSVSLFDTNGIACSVAGQVYTAGTQAGLQECFDQATHDGDTVHISANISLASPVTWTAPTNATFSGTTSCTGSGNPASANLACTDNTTITFDYAVQTETAAPTMIITTAATGLFEMKDISYTWGAGTSPADAAIKIVHLTDDFRIDHNHFNLTGMPGGNMMSLYGNSAGVFDHNLIDLPQGARQAWRTYGNGFGDANWNLPTGFGSENFIFGEDNLINGGYATDINDCQIGQKFVWRFNTTTGVQQHGTGSFGRGRGCRATEVYKNNFINSNGGALPEFAAFYTTGGPSMTWGNTFGTGIYNHFFVMEVNRRSNAAYNQAATPDGWGYCGTTQTGTGSNWDGNTPSSSGYPCADQVGRGVGDLMANQFPNAVNVTTGCGPSQTCAGLRQALEGAYEWLNVGTESGTYISVPVAVDGANLTENTDYYLYHGNTGCNQSAMACTTGVGSGTRAQRPTNCTTGVGWWSTDQGSWNQSGAGGQGVFDKCTGTNTWTNAFYTPFTYPHPLVNPIDYLVFTVQPTDVATGGAFSPVVVVTVTSPDGTTDTAATGNVVITINGCGASLTGTLTRAAVMGVATFTAMGASTAASGCILTASYTNVTPGTSNSFSVNGASAPTLSGIFPAISARGQTIPVTLTGTNLNTGNASISISGTAFSVVPGSIVVASSTSITARFRIAGNATTDVRTVTVTTDTGASGTVNFSILTQGLGVRPR